MGRTGSNDDSLPSHPNRSVDPSSRRVPERQIEGLAAKLVVRSKDNSTTLDGIIDPLTDAGSVKGAATIPSTVSLAVQGDATFDDTINIRGQAQFAEPGSTFNESGKLRTTVDNTGSMVLRVLSSLAEGIKGVLGSYSVTSGSLTNMSDAAWGSSTSVATFAGAYNAWVPAAASAVNDLTTADLHAYDGHYKVTGTVSAVNTDGAGSGFVAIHARVRAYVTYGGVEESVGVVGTVTHTDGTAATSTTAPFEFTFTVAGTPATISVRLKTEVNVEATGAFPGADYTGTLASVGAVTWKKSTSAAIGRRGFFVGAESAQPHLTLEPNIDDIITTSDSVEGEVVYDGTSHQIKYNDGTVIQAVATITDVNNAVIAGGATPRAEAAVTGTVRTDVTEVDPIVYTKATTDTLLDSIESDVDTLSTAVGTAQSDITDLQTDVADHESRIDTLEAAPASSLTSYDTSAAREAATPTDELIVFDEETQAFYQGNGTAWVRITDRTSGDINILDYGADPTGVADSTWAIQQALNDAITWGTEAIPYGLPVYMPPGEYRVTGPIVWRSRSGGSLYGAGPAVTTVRWEGGPDNNINRLMPVFAMQECMGVTVADFRITFGQLAYAGFTMETIFGYQLLEDGVTGTTQGFSTKNRFVNVSVENSNEGRILYGWAVQPVVGGYNAIVPRVEELSSSSRFGLRTVASAKHCTIADSTEAWAVNAFAGQYVEHFTGAGVRSTYLILSNTATEIQIDGAWGTLPIAGDTFNVIASTGTVNTAPGIYTVTSAFHARLVRSAGTAWIDGLFDTSFLVQHYADGSRDLTNILDNTTDTLYVAEWANGLPAVASEFYVGYQFRDNNNEHHEILSCSSLHALYADIVIGHSQAKAIRVMNFLGAYSSKCIILVVQGSVNCQGIAGGGKRFVHQDWTVGTTYGGNDYVRASNGFLYQNQGASAVAAVEPSAMLINGFETDGTLNWKCIAPISPSTTLPHRPYDFIYITSWDPCELSRSEAESSYGFLYYGGGMPLTVRSIRWSADKLQEGIDDYPAVIDNGFMRIGGGTLHFSNAALSDAPDFAAPRIRLLGGPLTLDHISFRTNVSHTTSPLTDDSVGDVLLRNNTYYLGTQEQITDGIIRSWWASTGGTLRTAHTVATTISEIQGALRGHEFTVLIADDYTTFRPGQYLLRDAYEWSPLKGSAITFAYNKTLAMWQEKSRAEQAIPEDISALAADIAAEGATLFHIADVRYHRIINGSDLVTTVRDSRFPAGGPVVTPPSGEEPTYDDSTSGQPFFAFAGGERFATAFNATGLSTLSSNMGLTVVGDPGAYSAVEIFADFSTNDHNSFIRLGRTTGGFLQATMNGTTAFTTAVALPAGTTVMHGRRDQIDASNARLYVRAGSAAETGHASDQAATVSSGNKMLVYGSRWMGQDYATALLGKAFLTINGLTNANATAVQDIINAWAVAQHGATV